MHLQWILYMVVDFLHGTVISLSLIEEIQAETSLPLTILLKKWN